MALLHSRTIPSDGLLHPVDLASWMRWETSAHRLQQVKGSLHHAVSALCPPSSVPRPVLSVQGEAPEVLVVVDAAKSSLTAALIRPVQLLLDAGVSIAVLSPSTVVSSLPHRDSWQARPALHSALDSCSGTVQAVLSAGHYLPLGSTAYQWAMRHNIRFCVIQHGLLTPFMAPLPDDAHLLAWTQEDADFWISGRHDVTYEVVGSQLLWQAAQEPATQVDPDARPVFLGQLHGIELDRSYMTRVSYDFCRGTGASYRPHPSEKDKLSRLTHALWERRGIEIDRTKVPLSQIGRPVAGVFSTGILEAAARGVPAWQVSTAGSGLGTKAPSWLQAFHSRYNMSSWGSAPTPRPDVPRTEPARAVIHALTTT